MVIIYGATWCRWCEKAKALAEQYQLDFQYRDIDTESHKQELKTMLPEATTIPQIWWHGRHVGGYEAFAEEIENTRNYGQEVC